MLSLCSTDAIPPQYWCCPPAVLTLSPTVLNSPRSAEQPPQYWTDVIRGVCTVFQTKVITKIIQLIWKISGILWRSPLFPLLFSVTHSTKESSFDWFKLHLLCSTTVARLPRNVFTHGVRTLHTYRQRPSELGTCERPKKYFVTDRRPKKYLLHVKHDMIIMKTCVY